MGSNKTIRLRTTPGESQNIQVKIEQDFDTLDVLSLKITQEEAYRNFCSDYGVIVGRVIANDGFGVENAKISIFIPISEEDQNNPKINSVYPYTTPNDLNTQGVRYNLLPKNGKRYTLYQTFQPGVNPNNLPHEYNYSYVYDGTITGSWVSTQTNPDGTVLWKATVDASYGPRVPVGTFPSKQEILDNDTLLEVYEKYYKLTTRTNFAGDYMIFGVPVGNQTVHMDVDLSDAGQASLTVDDFINAGYPQNLFDGVQFKSSTNLDALPQVESRDISVEVVPFWGNLDQCEIGITRVDFNLNKTITPSAVIFFQAFTNGSDWRIKHSCNDINGGSGSNASNFRSIGNMQKLGVITEALATGSGENINPQTFDDGNVFLTLPMYEDRYITDEFGNTVLTTDQTKGIPTGGRYRVYVYSSDRNIVDISGDDYGYATYIFGSSQFIKYRYDLDNKKRLIYTPGIFNGATTDGVGDDDNRISIASNDTNNSNRVPYPATYKNSGQDRFGRLDGVGSIPICYGSLYFMRLRYKNGEYCFKVADFINNTIPGGGVLMYSNSYNDQLGFRNVLDVTDVLPLFNVFGGGINSPSSGYLGIFNGSPLPTSGAGNNPRTIDHTIPLGTSQQVDTNGVTVYPNRLNMEDDSILETNVILNDISDIAQSGEKSKEGWYYFYFGLNYDDNSLLYLKEKLG